MQEFIAFGSHLMADCYSCDKDKLDNLDVVYTFLDQLPNLINMQKLIAPQVHRCVVGKEEDYGLSGFIIVLESHSVIHTFPLKNYLSLDVFSCKDFDPQIVINYAKETFNFEKYEQHLLNRGLEFPRNITLSKNIVERQRQEV